MDINKVNWTNSNEKIKMSFPIAKVNREKRTVSGFATLDNIDRHGDIVTPQASEKAFARFRGNLREMHQPIAVGKVVSFEPQDFLDKESGKTYKGIYVDAYISKGAQDTWEKVLDGTLTGFSIGGNIVEASYEPTDNNDDNRVIKDYELMELSLVDNPANPMANIFSIQKNSEGMTMKGIATEVSIENVFWCSSDKVATTAESDQSNCVVCGNAMSTIGWVEKSDENKSDTVKKLIKGYFQKDDAPGPDHAATTQDSDAITSQDTINLYPDQNPIKKGADSNSISKGGNEEMADETNIVEAAPVDEVAEEAVEEVTNDEAVEKAVTVSELPEDELDFVKMIGNIKKDFRKEIKKAQKSIKKNYVDATDSAGSVQKSLEDFSSNIQKSIDDFGSKVTDLSNNVAEITKRIDALEGATAVKKSGEIETSSDNTKITKTSIWQGHFLGVQDL
jgi:uncharacterized protein YeeX (DUF496 family)